MFKKIFFVVLFGSFLILPFQNVEAAGLVPCGSAEEGPCTICHLFLGIMGIIEFLRNLMVIVGLLVITLAGVMYVVSAGSSLTTMAKNAIKYAVIGIIVVLMAWLMIVFILKALSAKKVGDDSPNVWLKQEGTWSFSCSTESYIGGDGTSYDDQFIGDKDRDGIKDEEDNCPGSYNRNQEDSDGDGVGDVCEQQKPIPDGAACGSGTSGTKKPGEGELCDEGESKNLKRSGGEWVWNCVYTDSEDNITTATCSTRGEVDLVGTGYTFDSGISLQQKDASEELVTLLDCMDKAGLSQSARRISSISKTTNGESYYDICSDNNTYNKKDCVHKQDSCHFGGTNCKDKGSMAVDFGNENAYSEINKYAKACGASYVLNEGDHIHVSVGGANNCGCN